MSLRDKIGEKLLEYGLGDGGEMPEKKYLDHCADDLIGLVGSYFKDVGAFHTKFGLDTDETTPPSPLDYKTLCFRIGFMIEELKEFASSAGMPALAFELVKVGSRLEQGEFIRGRSDHTSLDDCADALADLVYVALGTAHMMGLPFDDVWAEVQRANMTKERATGDDDPRSKRKNALDVVKPLGWKAPDHAPAIATAFAKRAV